MTPFWAKMTLYGAYQANQEDRRRGISKEGAQYFEELITKYETRTSENTMNNTSNTITAKTMDEVIGNIYKSCAGNPQQINRGREFARYIHKISYYKENSKIIYLHNVVDIKSPVDLFTYNHRPDLFIELYIKNISETEVYTIRAYLYNLNYRKIVEAIDDYMKTEEYKNQISK